MSRSTQPRVTRGSFENVPLLGSNAGASMAVEGGGESPGSCSINIYINNDFQGINNSILVGSDVKMGDPGVRLCLEGLQLDRAFHMVRRNKSWDYWVVLVGFVVMVISFSAYLLV
ncbi:Unknown protein [Striga hermonthica]|uniref:Uncharacterized protein n=1 Tax=Striga hermonthica TaxID=68872 RepID=A0A9N7N824_STRHE|nr:Unknown protein [Striga hermonthica]